MSQLRMKHLSSPVLFTVLAVCFSAGCGPGDAVSTGEAPPAATGDEGHSHGNGGHGPHDGDVVKLGSDKYHAELVHSTGYYVTVYFFDTQKETLIAAKSANAKIQMNVDGEFQTYTLPAQPLDSPRFELISKELAAALDKRTHIRHSSGRRLTYRFSATVPDI